MKYAVAGFVLALVAFAVALKIAVLVAIAMSALVSHPVGYGRIGHDPLERIPLVGGEPAPILRFDPDTGKWKPVRDKAKYQ